MYLKYVHPGESSNLPSTIYYDNLIRLNRIEEPVAIIKYLKKSQDEKRKIIDFIYLYYEPTSSGYSKELCGAVAS